MPSRTARLSKKSCGFATPECRAQRDVAVHPRPAPPPPLLAAPRLSTTALGYLEIRWVVSRYNAEGLAALGDLRRHNGRAPALLKPDVLERLRVRLTDPPPDGGLWTSGKTSGKVARWMAGELGREAVSAQRGWEALRRIGWSIQKPRPRHPKAATPEEGAAFKKNWTK